MTNEEIISFYEQHPNEIKHRMNPTPGFSGRVHVWHPTLRGAVEDLEEDLRVKSFEEEEAA